MPTPIPRIVRLVLNLFVLKTLVDRRIMSKDCIKAYYINYAKSLLFSSSAKFY